MTTHARAALVLVALGAFAAASWFVFRSYLTPEMMVYFLSFRWCF